MSAPRFQLLVDAEEFWLQLEHDIADARHRVWLQTLSFEGDSAGTPLTRALLDSRAADRRLLIDAFSMHIQSDRFIYSPGNFFSEEVRAEVKATRTLIADLKRAGVGVGITNPAGFFWHRLPARDHRKLVLIDDDVAYIGGINFSEHNFAWHDIMIRIEHAGVAALLRADFLATWSNRPVHSRAAFDGITLYNLSGEQNEPECTPLLEMIAAARQSILVITPYLSFPFTDAMAQARASGAAVSILSPAINNRKSHRQYVRRLAETHDFELRYYTGRMSHLKAMLIDGDKLIVGSSNFDWPTYNTLAETIAVITDANFIAEFVARVVEPDIAMSEVVVAGNAGIGGWWGEMQHRVWAAGAKAICRPKPGKRIRF